ncbi:MAG: hypothetical protein N4A48_14610 [Tepidibacter sp.]|jgi:hypothetical protein|uniref:hypothetical protein n=1 Tax=Tepidibacter sp. TaxID=2529387 RepID=UPI0025DB80DF|nr:hypothetical protein [Tepidibacter sp.]MCT4509960.1 hypothetical protein [Tepidibacter sp.]
MNNTETFLHEIKSDLDNLDVGCLNLEKVYIDEKDKNTNNGIEIEWYGEASDGHYDVVNSDLYTSKARQKIRAKLENISFKVNKAAKKGLIQDEQELWS